MFYSDQIHRDLANAKHEELLQISRRGEFGISASLRGIRRGLGLTLIHLGEKIVPSHVGPAPKRRLSGV